MTALATGIDLIEIQRLQSAIERHGARFLERIFTSNELAEAGESLASLAARFAAKEAVAKALGSGIGPVRWKEIEILRAPNGQPKLHLHGAATQLAAERGLGTWSLSLSHSQDFAIAIAVALGESGL
jgi:holo-[acyl-carrier protein] synthase